jgi:AcrR family transcriptional regulator
MARTTTKAALGGPAPVEPLGLREQNKLDKLRRIKEAARELFVAKGFDDTTTREIAQRARVGIGTLFIYADNKRDLLFLVANDELEQATLRAEAGIRDDASLLQNLLTLFRHHYEFFSAQPELSRMMLREMIFYDSGRQAERFRLTRERVIRLVGQVVDIAAQGGTVKSAEPPGFIGWVAFCIYQVELRLWLASKNSNLALAMVDLKRALELFIRGLNPAEGALRVSAPDGSKQQRKSDKRQGRKT